VQNWWVFLFYWVMVKDKYVRQFFKHKILYPLIFFSDLYNFWEVSKGKAWRKGKGGVKSHIFTVTIFIDGPHGPLKHIKMKGNLLNVSLYLCDVRFSPILILLFRHLKKVKGYKNLHWKNCLICLSLVKEMFKNRDNF
jgi:hypothetical protein